MGKPLSLSRKAVSAAFPRIIAQIRPNFTLLENTVLQYAPTVIRVEGGLMRANSLLRVRTFVIGSGAGNKDIRICPSTSATPGTDVTMMGYYIAANITGEYEFCIHNDGALNAQISPPRPLGTGSSSAAYTGAIDTTQPFYLHFGSVKATASDAMTIKTVTAMLELGA